MFVCQVTRELHFEESWQYEGVRNAFSHFHETGPVSSRVVSSRVISLV